MSGQAPISPTTMDTTILQTGQPPGSISPLDAQLMEDSLSGMFSNTQSASFTLTQAMRGTRQRYASTSAGTATIPTNATVPFQIGATIMFCQTNTGKLTLAGASGVQLLGPTTAPFTARTQFSHIWIIQDGIDVWLAGGDLT